MASLEAAGGRLRLLHFACCVLVIAGLFLSTHSQGRPPGVLKQRRLTILAHPEAVLESGRHKSAPRVEEVAWEEARALKKTNWHDGAHEALLKARVYVHGGKPFAGQQFGSLQELVAAMPVDPVPVAITVATSDYQELALNWASFARAAGLEKVVILALDDAVFKMCQGHGIWSARVSSSPHIAKVEAISAFLQAKQNVLSCDADMVLTMDPLPLVFDPDRGAMRADVIVASDCISPQSDELSVQGGPQDGPFWFRSATRFASEEFGNIYESAFNTGVSLFRSNRPAALKFVEEWLLVLRQNEKVTAKEAFNSLARQALFPLQTVPPEAALEFGGKTDLPESHDSRVFYVYNTTLKLGIFPVLQVCGGHVCFVQRAPQRLGVRTVMVHASGGFHGVSGKKGRLRTEYLWAVDGESFYAGKFLTFDEDEAQPIVDEHILQLFNNRKAIRHYYVSIRNSLAVARLLNRTLILPPLLCHIDRANHDLRDSYRMPGADYTPPSIFCNADMALNLAHWEKHNVPFREMGFLDHPLLPPIVKDSRVEVIITPQSTPKVATPRSTPQRNRFHRALSSEPRPSQVTLAANPSEDEVLKALGGLADVAVLHLKSPHRSFCKFREEVENEEFDELISGPGGLLVDEWCCVPTEVGPSRNPLPPPLAKRVECSRRPSLLRTSRGP